MTARGVNKEWGDRGMSNLGSQDVSRESSEPSLRKVHQEKWEQGLPGGGTRGVRYGMGWGQSRVGVNGIGTVIHLHCEWTSHPYGGGRGEGWENREAGRGIGTGRAFRDEPVQPSSPGILYPLTRILAPLAGPRRYPESKEASACLGAARSDRS